MSAQPPQMRLELVEALGLSDGDAIYLWGDLLRSVRGLVEIAHAAVSGLDKPEDEYFNPWALRMTKERVARLRGLLVGEAEEILAGMVELGAPCEGVDSPAWRVGDRYLGRNGVGVVVELHADGLYGCEGPDRLVYEYGPDDACCSPLSELRSLRASPIVGSLAALWARRVPMLMTQAGALSRWVSDRADAGAEVLADALNLTPSEVAEILAQGDAT